MRLYCILLAVNINTIQTHQELINKSIYFKKERTHNMTNNQVSQALFWTKFVHVCVHTDRACRILSMIDL